MALRVSLLLPEAPSPTIVHPHFKLLFAEVDVKVQSHWPSFIGVFLSFVSHGRKPVRPVISQDTGSRLSL